MNKIELQNIFLKTFTEQNAIDYCQINNINPEDITELYLNDNELTDISGVKPFKNLIILTLHKNYITDISCLKDLKNLNILSLSDNQITDISVLKDLNKLKQLNIDNLQLDSNQFKYIKNLKNLEDLVCEYGFKDIKVLKQLNSNIKLW